MRGAGYSLEQLEIRAAFLAVSYNYAPKKIALVAAGLEGDLSVMRERVETLTAERDDARREVEACHAILNRLQSVRAELLP